MMRHIQITITANEYQQEELMAFLSDLEPSGFEQKENELIVYFDEQKFQPQAVKNILTDYHHKTATVAEKNWNEEWERNFQPVVIENFCAIRADFHQPISNIEHDIIITPKMSFGTGHHATTHMMIEQMQNIDFINKTIFDFGTGTGILAILAEKLGAKEITAIDVDHWSIENAKENCERNRCSKISFSLSSEIPQKKFDVILANINRNVLIQYSQQLKKSLTFPGYLLLSGLLANDKEEIEKRFLSPQLTLVNFLQRENWISMLFINRSSREG